MRPTKKLRELIARPGALMAPGVADALNARLVARHGFDAVYMTGAGTTAVRLGMPDVGLLTMTEMVDNAARIADASGLPLIADADNGYGGVLNVRRTVQAYERAGVAGIHIEDQAIPKRCGHVAGRQVIPLAEAVGKYRAAASVRDETDPDFVLIARTDARGAHGGTLDDAIRRANAYLEAGADMAFVEGPTSLDEVRRICREVRGPIFYNQTGVSPRLSLPEMQDLGIAIAILPGAAMRATVQAVHDLGVALRDRGPLAEAEFNESFKGHPLADIHTFAGFDQIRAWEEAYLPPEELAKYADSVGHQPTRA